MSGSAPYPPRTDLMRWDESRDEPYLVIPSHPDLRLTPWREEDAEQAVKLYNEPSVAKYSFRRPYPYLPEHLSWPRTTLLPPARTTIDTVLRPLLAPPTQPTHPLPPLPANSSVPFFPFIILRHQPTGKMIGDLMIFQPVPPGSDPEEAAAFFGGTKPQEAPPQDQTWELAYNLMPEWQGKGVGGAMLDVLIESWVAWVGIGTLQAGAETANIGSTALAKSRGFSKKLTRMEKWPEDKGGGEREMSEWILRMADRKRRLDPFVEG